MTSTGQKSILSKYWIASIKEKHLERAFQLALAGSRSILLAMLYPQEQPRRVTSVRGAAISLLNEINGKNENIWCLGMTSNTGWVRGRKEGCGERGSTWEAETWMGVYSHGI